MRRKRIKKAIILLALLVLPIITIMAAKNADAQISTSTPITETPEVIPIILQVTSNSPHIVFTGTQDQLNKQIKNLQNQITQLQTLLDDLTKGQVTTL